MADYRLPILAAATGLTSSQAVMTDANSKLVSADYLDQSVKQAASPTFASQTLTGNLLLNTASSTITFNEATDVVLTGASGQLNLTGNLDVSAHLAVGGAASIAASEMVSITETLTGTGATSQKGIYCTPNFTPGSDITSDQIAIGGYSVPVTTNWGSGGRCGGLSFGNFGAAFNTTGNTTYMDWVGTATFGAASYVGTIRAKDVYGLKAVSFDNNTLVLMGGGTLGNTLTATNAYGIKVFDPYSLGATGSLTNNYIMYLEDPTVGTNKYQLVLEGTGTGTGIWFGGTSGKRAYSDGTNFYLTGMGSGSGNYPVEYTTATGKLTYDTSSYRYKENVTNYQIPNAFNLLNIQPKHYTRKDTGNEEIGYIAEDLDELGLKDLVVYDEKGRPDAINRKNIPVYLVEIIKNQEQRINQLENTLINKFKKLWRGLWNKKIN